MVDKIDELINSLMHLKEEKLSSEDISTNVFNLFKSEQENFNNTTESIYEKIESLKEEVNLVDQKRALFFSKLDSLSQSNKQYSTNDNNNQNDKNYKDENSSNFKLKKFYKQESLLSELMKKNNYQTIYNIFLSFLLINIAIFTLQGVIEDKFVVNFSNLFKHFDGGLILLKFMIFKHLWAIFSIVIINFVIIKLGRNNIKKINIIFIISLMISFAILFSFFKPNKEFSMTIRILHYTDNLSCLFKLISYYFEKVLLLSYNNLKPKLSPEIIAEESSNKSCILIDNGDEELKINFKNTIISKEIKNFFYFYYVPTLIYRDAYPRIKKINFFMILIHFINLNFSITFLFLIIELKFFPLIQDKNFDFLKNDFIRTLVTFCLYSMILLFVIFFGFFHSYFNLLAEILRFGDKNFYSDFFNSLNPNDFMLKLSNYYNDFFEFYLTKILQDYIPRELGKIILYVFFIEYILSSSMNNFCPVFGLTIVFCYLASFPFKLIEIHQKQFLNWLFVTFFTGFSVLVLFIEYIIRFNNGENNYIAYNFIDEILKNNSNFAWLLPKIVFLMF